MIYYNIIKCNALIILFFICRWALKSLLLLLTDKSWSCHTHPSCTDKIRECGSFWLSFMCYSALDIALTTVLLALSPSICILPPVFCGSSRRHIYSDKSDINVDVDAFCVPLRWRMSAMSARNKYLLDMCLRDAVLCALSRSWFSSQCS